MKTVNIVAHEVVTKLIALHQTITMMESCTAGMVASLMTDTEGASAIFLGSHVTYSNEAKIQAGVDADIINRYGVYSPECAEAMARAAQKNFAADLAIGITGNTGNVDPNNPSGVIGEVYFCIICKNEAHAFHYQTDVKAKSRHEIKKEYSEQVFWQLKKLLSC